MTWCDDSVYSASILILGGGREETLLVSDFCDPIHPTWWQTSHWGYKACMCVYPIVMAVGSDSVLYSGQCVDPFLPYPFQENNIAACVSQHAVPRTGWTSIADLYLWGGLFRGWWWALWLLSGHSNIHYSPISCVPDLADASLLCDQIGILWYGKEEKQTWRHFWWRLVVGHFWDMPSGEPITGLHWILFYWLCQWLYYSIMWIPTNS